MITTKPTLKQLRDLRAGATVQFTVGNDTIIVTPYQINYAKDKLTAGNEIVVLGEVVGENRMEELHLTI